MFETHLGHSEYDQFFGKDTLVSSPYITYAFLNGIIPGDVQGEPAMAEIVNMDGSTQRCSGICRINSTLSAY